MKLTKKDKDQIGIALIVGCIVGLIPTLFLQAHLAGQMEGSLAQMSTAVMSFIVSTALFTGAVYWLIRITSRVTG